MVFYSTRDMVAAMAVFPVPFGNGADVAIQKARSRRGFSKAVFIAIETSGAA